jgi:hypothetical protein
VEVKHNLLNPWALRAKRMLHLLGVVVGGLLISPLLLTIAALIKLTSPGPVFCAQQRLGSENRHFRCWKFRTMYADADFFLTELLQNNAELRSEWERNQKLRSDPRVTPLRLLPAQDQLRRAAAAVERLAWGDESDRTAAHRGCRSPQVQQYINCIRGLSQGSPGSGR